MISNPLIREGAIQEREYQVNIARSCLRGNTLVVLPTGLGKTVIAILVIAEVLHRKGGKILFLAPTKPLVEQHARSIRKMMKVEDDVVVFTGEVKKSRRGEMWNSAKIVVSTPQVIENDLSSGCISLEDVNLIIFDEAHRAVGNYAYVGIAKEYRKKEDHLILAITASPGGKEERIMEIIENLGIENVEIRTEDDPDVRPYVKEVKVRYVELPMPEKLKELSKMIKDLYNDIVEELRHYGLFLTVRKVSRKDILMAQAEVQEKIKDGKSEYYQAAMLLNMAIKVDYALEYLETQGFESCYTYLMKIVEEGNSRGGSKASRTLVRHEKFIKIVKLARELAQKVEEIENPKLNALKTILRKKIAENPDSRIIVFTHYRDTAKIVEEHLKNTRNIRAVRFVGQANRGEDKGMSQREQAEIIEKFRRGEYNVLIATSIAEEGLDIPSTDLVIFYEPVPSEIRSIQRRGRTGRTSVGEVYILTIRGTRDVAYLWSSRHKERKMKKELKWLRKFLSQKVKGSNRKIFPDEKSNDEEDRNEGEEVSSKGYAPRGRGQLTLFEFEEGENAEGKSLKDYLDISEEIGIRRISMEELLVSAREGSIFRILADMRGRYRVPVLIVEVNREIMRGGDKKRFYETLAKSIVDFGIFVVVSHKVEETYEIISALRGRARKG